MTLMVGWVGVDTHGVSSAYIASDSRIAWLTQARFDHARKVYGLEISPDLFGCCGDVLFPAVVLGQISEMANAGLLFAPTASPSEKAAAVLAKLREQFSAYPGDVANITDGAIQILHLSRDCRRRPVFQAYFNEWRRGGTWGQRELKIPSESGPVAVLGSGHQVFRDMFMKYQHGPTAATSRSVFHCFCRAVASSRHAGVGGAPQLVGLYRGKQHHAIKYGILTGGKRFMFGASIEGTPLPDCVEWRNELFELCDGKTGIRLASAQAQSDPLAG